MADDGRKKGRSCCFKSLKLQHTWPCLFNSFFLLLICIIGSRGRRATGRPWWFLPRATQTQPQVPSLSSLVTLLLLCNLSHIIPNCICSHASHKTILFIYSSTSTFGSLVTRTGARYFIVAKGPGLYTVAIRITVQSNEDEDRIVQHQARQNQPILCLSLRNTSARIQLFFDHQSTSKQRLEEHAGLRRVFNLLHPPLCHELSYFLRFSLRHCLIQSHPKQSRTLASVSFNSSLNCFALFSQNTNFHRE